MTPKKPRKSLAQELYEHRHDSDEWDEEPVELDVRPAKTAVISCRMPREELDGLEEAAQAARETISEYVRKAVMMRRGGNPPPYGVSVNYAVGNAAIQIVHQSAWGAPVPMNLEVKQDYTVAVVDE
jgi:hypothetical protein